MPPRSWDSPAQTTPATLVSTRIGGSSSVVATVGRVSPARHNPYNEGESPNTLLARARLSRGVTQEELAEAVGVSAQTIRRLERGEVENRETPPSRRPRGAPPGA